MKKFLLALFTVVLADIVVLICPSQCADSSQLIILDGKLKQTKENIEAQIERIKNAREKSDTEMNLARLRIAEQLRRSEEDLLRQIFILERYREQLSEQTGATNSIISDMQMSWKQQLDAALTNIESQIQQTNSLISQMEKVRERLVDTLPDTKCCNDNVGINSSNFATAVWGLGDLPKLEPSPQLSPQVDISPVAPSVTPVFSPG